MNYKLVWLEDVSSDEETNKINKETWDKAGFTFNDDGECFEVIATITPKKNEYVINQMLTILEQYSRGLDFITFGLYDQDNNTILTEEYLD